ncbi:unnamed protein product [Cuscuta campestris]|uniref:Pentatricopeptide repeat-containing protein n=1 Tax=Cuscuta campestris TaxID=132261 RepID=A0A484L4U5_9ASTE|nr:unnamed protein product [Cuscuta campestris]
MGLEMLLPWTVEAEFGISCSFPLDATVYHRWSRPPDIISFCESAQSLRQVQQTHAQAVLHGVLPASISVSAALILRYALFGSSQKTCQILFSQSAGFARSPFLHNTLIRAHGMLGVCCRDGFLVYNEMFRSCVMPDDHTFPFVLKLCSDFLEVRKGLEAHGMLLKLSFDSDVYVNNTLLSFYGSCGDSLAARKVFDEMPEKDLVSWNSVIRVFSDNSCCTLPVCAALEDSKVGRGIHCCIFKVGLDTQLSIGNALIDAYGKCREVEASRRVFDEMTERNDVTWNATIVILGYNGCYEHAFSSFREVHGFSVRMGLDRDVFVSNSLIDMYSKSGHSTRASNVFHHMDKKNAISFNAMIANFAQNSLQQEAIALHVPGWHTFAPGRKFMQSHSIAEMGHLGMKHDTVSFVGALSACSNASEIKKGKEIHGFAVRRIFHSHQFVANSLLDLYTKCGQIDISRRIFDRMSHRDAASWNTMVLGYGMIGQVQTAIDLFESMRDDGVKYDSVSYIAVLSACSHGGLIEQGRRFFDEMIACNDIKPTEKHYANMVDLLGRCGLVDEAVHLVQSLPIEADSNVWGALLGACRLHGKLDLGCWAADQLLKLKPNHSGYYALLSNMYADAGRWKDADRVRELMKVKGVKKMPGCSWVQMQDQVYAFIAGERFEQLGSHFVGREV